MLLDTKNFKIKIDDPVNYCRHLCKKHVLKRYATKYEYVQGEYSSLSFPSSPFKFTDRRSCTQFVHLHRETIDLSIVV